MNSVDSIFKVLDMYGLCLDIEDKPRALNESELRSIAARILRVLWRIEIEAIMAVERKDRRRGWH